MPIRIEPLPIPGAFLIASPPIVDARGTFSEVYRRSVFEAAGIREHFVQANRSRSRIDVLRGLHFQRGIHAQGKLVRVTSGEVFDVCVDLRPGSPAFRQVWTTHLTDDGTQVYLPPGCAHGFLTLSVQADFEYFCTAEYDSNSEVGIRWDDPDLGIPWPAIRGQIPILSPRDGGLPRFRDLFPQALPRS
jgi:dTDP-4-dehydrorhamnose 3,5-epimerase